MNQTESKIQIHLFYLIALIGITVFLQNSWVEGMFYDGHLYAAFGKNAADKGYWLVPHLAENAYPRFDQHPPFIFILEGVFFKIFGVSQVSARLFISIFSLGTLGFLYKTVKRVIGEREAIVSSFFFLLIPALLKKARFPNMDVPLMLFSFVTLFYYYIGTQTEKKSLISWVLCGLFFGLSLLTKGAMGAIIPAAIGFHILLTNNWKVCLDKGFWIAFILGLCVFSLWPIALHLSGNFEIFEGYYGYVFGLGSGKSATDFHSPFYTHLVFYLKQMPHLFIPFVFGVRYAFKNKNNFHLFIISSFIGMVFLLSLSSVKVSNYLLPTYPFLAIGACLAFAPYLNRNRVYSWVRRSILFIAIVLPMALLILPLTNKSSRDKPLYETLNVLKTLKLQSSIKKWVIVDESYPFWNVANWAAWKGAGMVHQEGLSEVIKNDFNEKVFILPTSINLSEMGLRELVLFRDPKNKLVLISEMDGKAEASKDD